MAHVQALRWGASSSSSSSRWSLRVTSLVRSARRVYGPGAGAAGSGAGPGADGPRHGRHDAGRRGRQHVRRGRVPRRAAHVAPEELPPRQLHVARQPRLQLPAGHVGPLRPVQAAAQQGLVRGPLLPGGHGRREDVQRLPAAQRGQEHARGGHAGQVGAWVPWAHGSSGL